VRHFSGRFSVRFGLHNANVHHLGLLEDVILLVGVLLHLRGLAQKHQNVVAFKFCKFKFKIDKPSFNFFFELFSL